MAEQYRYYEEGNKNFRVAEYNTVNGTYGEPKKIEGLQTVDITFSRTTDKKAADDIPDYLLRRSPLSGSGTITFIGLTKKQHDLLYVNILDSNGVLTFGDTGEPKHVGIMFDTTGGSTAGQSVNRMVLYNCVFDDPNLSTQTKADDNTDIRDYTLNVTVTAIQVNNKSVTYSKLNSIDDKDAFATTENAMYNPNGASAASLGDIKLD